MSQISKPIDKKDIKFAAEQITYTLAKFNIPYPVALAALGVVAETIKNIEGHTVLASVGKPIETPPAIKRIVTDA